MSLVEYNHEEEQWETVTHYARPSDLGTAWEIYAWDESGVVAVEFDEDDMLYKLAQLTQQEAQMELFSDYDLDKYER